MDAPSGSDPSVGDIMYYAHWHGATENRSLSQLYIVPNTEKGIVNWQEAVTDEQYKSTK